MKFFLWCQDKKEQLQLNHLLCSFLDNIGEENFDIVSFVNAETLMNECRSGLPTIAYFVLSREHPLIGLQIARHFQDITGGEVPFVLIGYDKESAFDAYEIGAVYYIQQPIGFVQMKRCYERCIEALGGMMKSLRVICHYKSVSIPFYHLMYVQEKGKKAHIYVEGRQKPISVYLPAKTLCNRLSDRRFVSSYRGYIINLDFVENIDANSVYMADGTILPCKKRDSSKIQALYHDYRLSRVLPRTHAMVELIRYRDRLRVVLQVASICVFEVDILHQTYTFFDNAEAIFGISGKKILEDVRPFATLPPEQYRKKVTEYFSRQEDAAVIKEAFQKIYDGHSASYEADMKAGGTKFVHCRIDVMPIMRNGVPIRMVGLIKKLNKHNSSFLKGELI